MSRTYRLAYLVSHPIQYQAPMLRYVAAHPQIDLTVFFLSDVSVREHFDPGFGVALEWDISLLEGYKHVFLPVLFGRKRVSFWSPMVYGLRRRLLAGRFDALWIHSCSHPIFLRALTLAKSLALKVFLRGESNLNSRTSFRPKAWLKDQMAPRLFRAIDGFLAIGTLNRAYYLHYGAPEERIFTMPYAVDNDFFHRRVRDARRYRKSLRRELALEHGRPVILYASKFLSRKRPGDLLEAYARLSPDGIAEPEPYLLFVGDGKERPHLEASVRKLGWSSVKFLGFKSQAQLARYYDLCEVFVLPSEREPWGLVVNEVMNAGKAVIVSDQVGAGPDLVADGINGFVVPVGDVELLANRLRLLVGNPELARRMGKESHKRICKWDFEADLRGLLKALGSVVGQANET